MSLVHPKHHVKTYSLQLTPESTFKKLHGYPLNKPIFLFILSSSSVSMLLRQIYFYRLSTDFESLTVETETKWYFMPPTATPWISA